jgi:glucose/mannose-6-phosphate isomerase
MLTITTNSGPLNRNSQTVPRLSRYKRFLETEFLEGMLRNDEYSIELLKEDLLGKIKKKQFSKIVFTGMGCSAIVSDLIKGFFISEGIPIEVEVINDYDLEYLIGKKTLSSDSTLIIISSYSGHSQEPINAYNAMKKINKNIIFLTSGGKLGELGIREEVSIIYWRLKSPDREYPLFHVPQYLSILLNVFHGLGMLPSNYQRELTEMVSYLKEELSEEKKAQAVYVAEQLKDRDIVLLATAKWYEVLLKIVKMHFNEMAMAPAHCNYFHEFCHSEVAVLSDPVSRQGIVLFKDEEDDYTEEKIQNLMRLLSPDLKQNHNISFIQLEMNQDSFLKKLFSTLLFIHYVTYELGRYYNVSSRGLISGAAQNPWYSIETIKREEGVNQELYV